MLRVTMGDNNILISALERRMRVSACCVLEKLLEDLLGMLLEGCLRELLEEIPRISQEWGIVCPRNSISQPSSLKARWSLSIDLNWTV